MALSRRQQRLYDKRVDLYKPTGTAAIGGKVSITYPDIDSPTYENIACISMFRTSLTDPAEVALVEHDIFGTMDVWHFDVAQPIDDAWYIRDMTEGSPTYGQFWKVRGNAVRTQKLGRRKAQHTEVQTVKMEKPEIV